MTRQNKMAPLANGSNGQAKVLDAGKRCACGDVTECHRKVVAERLAAAWGAEVKHLSSSVDGQVPAADNEACPNASGRGKRRSTASIAGATKA